MPHREYAGKSAGHRSAVGMIALLLALSILPAIATAVSGCGTGDAGPTTTLTAGDSTTTSFRAKISHPTGKDELVLRVSTTGGLVPVSYSLTHTPEFSLYGDGTVIVTGAVPEIYPGPAMPNLQTAAVTENQIQEVLAAADTAGLFTNDTDYGQPNITDMGTTTFTLNAGDKNYKSQVYALGMEESATGLTDEQVEAREGLDEFRNKAYDLSGLVDTEIKWADYVFKSLAVYSQPVSSTEATSSTEVQPNTLAWPLADLTTLGQPADGGYRRVVVTGADLEQLRPLLGEATQITLWTSGGKTYHLYMRPLLPDEKN